MGVNYYERRVDTFLPSVSVKPKDNREYGYTQKDIEEKRQKLLAAVQKKEKFRHL